MKVLSRRIIIKDFDENIYYDMESFYIRQLEIFCNFCFIEPLKSNTYVLLIGEFREIEISDE